MRHRDAQEGGPCCTGSSPRAHPMISRSGLSESPDDLGTPRSRALCAGWTWRLRAPAVPCRGVELGQNAQVAERGEKRQRVVRRFDQVR